MVVFPFQWMPCVTKTYTKQQYSIFNKGNVRQCSWLVLSCNHRMPVRLVFKPSSKTLVPLSKKLNPHCSVLVSSRNRYKSDLHNQIGQIVKYGKKRRRHWRLLLQFYLNTPMLFRDCRYSKVFFSYSFMDRSHFHYAWNLYLPEKQ